MTQTSLPRFHRYLSPGTTVLITRGNSRLVDGLFAQMEYVMKTAELDTIIDEIVEAGLPVPTIGK